MGSSMSTIVTRQGKGSPLTWAEVDDNFINLNNTKLETSAAFSGAYADLTGKPTLGTAAATNITDYATAAQGTKADSAVQPNTDITFNTLTATGQTSLGGAAGSEAFRAVTTASGVNWIEAKGAIAGATPKVYSAGSDTNIAFALYSKGGSPVQVLTNNGSQLQLNVAHTSNAVNYVQVTGSATGGDPVTSVQGSDTNIAYNFTSKGNGAFNFFTNNSAQRQFRIQHTTSAVNFGYVTGSAAGGAVTFGVDALSSDTNIDLALTPKGTGNVRFGTYSSLASTTFSIDGFIEIKDSAGNIRKLAVIV